MKRDIHAENDSRADFLARIWFKDASRMAMRGDVRQLALWVREGAHPIISLDSPGEGFTELLRISPALTQTSVFNLLRVKLFSCKFL